MSSELKFVGGLTKSLSATKSMGKRLPKEGMTIKLGAFNDDLHTVFSAAAKIAAECGVDGLAVRAVGGRNVADLETEEVRQISRDAKDHGIEIASIGSQFGRGFYLEDDDAATRAYDHLSRALRYADICGTPLVRAFGGWLRGQEPLAEWSRRPSYPEYLSKLVDRLTPAVRAAERAGAKLMFELEGASYVGTVAEAAAFFAAIRSDALALCWDVCNGWWSGELPLDGLRRLDSLPLADVHTKDVPALPNDSNVASFGRAVVGQGDIGYSRLLPELVRRGYAGYVTAERVHHPLKPEDNREAQNATLADINGLKAILGRS